MKVKVFENKSVLAVMGLPFLTKVECDNCKCND